MEVLAFLASCLASAHYALFVYGVLSNRLWYDYNLATITFLTGLVGLMLFAMCSVWHEKQELVFGLFALGGTTFYSSTIISLAYPIAKTLLLWAVSVVHNIGSLNSLRKVEAKKVAIKNILTVTINAILNALYIIL